ncbi:MAG: glycosyltransferase family 2 protein [Caldilineales bacterium]|nr:glycosyltransferase family 2 protein [Caldilineales bacterium]
MTDLDLSVIIVSWNVRQHLLNCIASLPDAIGPGRTWELVVVDNASSDDSAAAVREKFPQARVVANPKNHLYTAAANQGLALAAGRFLLLLNPDCRLSPGSVAHLLDYIESNRQTGLAGPRILNEFGVDDRRTARNLPTPWSETLDWLGLTRRFPNNPIFAANLRPDYPRDRGGPVPLLSGACLLFSNRLTADLRRLDPGFPMYGEDVDLCRRIQMAGFDTSLAAGAVIVHSGGESSRQSRVATAILAADGIQRYFRRWHGRNAAFRHRLGMAFVAALKWSAFGILGLIGYDNATDEQRHLHASLFRWATIGGLPS